MVFDHCSCFACSIQTLELPLASQYLLKQLHKKLLACTSEEICFFLCLILTCGVLSRKSGPLRTNIFPEVSMLRMQFYVRVTYALKCLSSTLKWYLDCKECIRLYEYITWMFRKNVHSLAMSHSIISSSFFCCFFMDISQCKKGRSATKKYCCHSGRSIK